MIVNCFGKFEELTAISKFKVLVIGEVEFELQQRCQFQQLLA